MQRLALTLSLVLSVTGTLACSDNGSDDGGEETGGTGGSATGGSTTGGSSGASTGGSATGGATTGGSGGSATGGSSTGGAAGTGGSGGGGFTKRGVCGQKGSATVTETAYSEGVEEFYMVSEENVAEGLLDQFICHIRYDVTRVGTTPPGCVDLQGMPCLWTHEVRISNPTVVTNENGACEANEFLWDAAWRAEQDGTEAAYGYIYMYEGHNSVVMKASGAPGSETWSVFGGASWDETSGAFEFDNRFGNCRY